MTSTVKIAAHCADDKEVKITITNYEGVPWVIRLQNGEVYDTNVFDNRAVAVEEVLKGDE